jgi:TatD DNase family protein
MFDAHIHLQDSRLDACRAAVMDAAVAAGVQGACCCGTAPDDWAAVAQLGVRSAECGTQSEECGTQSAERGMRNLHLPPSPARSRNVAGFGLHSAFRTPHSAFTILPAFGVHPWFVADLPPDWCGRLEQVLTAHPAAPVGEIGLDGLRPEIPRDRQRQVLDAQLELAARLGRPVVLHGARAWGELLAALKPFASRLPGFVVHGFSSSADLLREVVALGGAVSFAGSVCQPQAARVRAAAAAAPADRLLVETDTPDIFPLGGVSALADAPRLNQPANLALVIAAVAGVRGAPPGEIAALTAANARRVLGLPLFGS